MQGETVMSINGKTPRLSARLSCFSTILCYCLPCFLLTLLNTPAESALIKFEYDPAGNMVSEQGKYYEYNDANQLVRVRKDSPDGEILAEYVYDYQGQRVKKIENGVTTYYIGKHYEERKGATVDEKTSYFFANSQRIAKSSQKNKAPPEVSYYLNNHLGSADVIIDEQGTQTDRIRYFPYGGYRTFPKEKHTFTGKERDEVTDNYYFEARYYNPNIRRFTQADTIVPDLYDPQSLNRYAYVLNNPIKYIDPTGHAPKPRQNSLKKWFRAKQNKLRMKMHNKQRQFRKYLVSQSLSERPPLKTMKQGGFGFDEPGLPDTPYASCKGVTEDYHNGIDLKAVANTPVFAPEQGKVTSRSYDSTKGQFKVTIIGDYTKMTYKFVHLANNPKLKKGQPVAPGDKIGVVGNSAVDEWSTGPHLHLSVKNEDGACIDPASIFTVEQ
ncbi:MAG: hypothetical protein D3904_04070 [Candidatus Electrothrix sp. EH2]|nr:hypothetical protein [Candidatus Electrothrix sp. EH2]